MPSETDYAYLAGIVDGEGYVGVGKNHGIVLCMADVQIVYWCHEHFGGCLSDRWKSERNARSRRIWAIRAKAELIALIPRLLPYTVLKGRELELCLEYSLCGLPRESSGRRTDPSAHSFHTDRDRLAALAKEARAARKLVC